MAIFEAENNIEQNCGNAVKAASEISKKKLSVSALNSIKSFP